MAGWSVGRKGSWDEREAGCYGGSRGAVSRSDVPLDHAAWCWSRASILAFQEAVNIGENLSVGSGVFKCRRNKVPRTVLSCY